MIRRKGRPPASTPAMKGSRMTDFSGPVFVADDNRLLARVPAHGPGSQYDEAQLRELLKQAGYGNWFLFEQALATLLACCNEAGDETELQVGERRDGTCRLEVAEDGSTAWFELTPAWGGRDIVRHDLVHALAEAGVSHGLDLMALQKACPVTQDTRLEIARATPPQDGADARFELQIDLIRERVPQVDAQGLIDFRELGPIPVVEPGQALLRRIAPTAGRDGHDVRNKVLTARSGRDLAFGAGLTGVAVDAQDPDLLRAVVKGQPVRVEGGVLVEQVVRCAQVDIGTGNVTYDGSVQIDGDVMSGMHVKASGDIIVGGTVDGGVLEAGGNVQVGGGIISHARVHAGGGVAARFVEHSEISAGTSITIEDMVLQSELRALNQIVIGAKSSERGRLVGGFTSAMLLVRVPYLAGGLASSATHVQVGLNPELDARHQELVQLARQRSDEEEKLRKQVQLLSKTGDQERLARVRQVWRQVAQALAEVLKDKQDVEVRLALVAGARIEVTEGASGAIDLHFGKVAFPLQQSYGAGTFRLSEGRLAFAPAQSGH